MRRPRRELVPSAWWREGYGGGAGGPEGADGMGVFGELNSARDQPSGSPWRLTARSDVPDNDSQVSSRTIAYQASAARPRHQLQLPVVDNLVDDGQLELGANPDHTRAPLISLTSAGQDTLAAVIQNSDQNRGALLKRAGTTAAALGC